MKSCIAMVLLMSLTPLANATQEPTRPDAMDCVWGDGSFELECGNWSSKEQARITNLLSMARAHKNSLTSSLPNDSLNSQQAISQSLFSPALNR